MNIPFFVGTYTQINKNKHRANGIFAFAMNPETGAVKQVAASPAGYNPSFIRLHPNRKMIYCSNEQSTGGVSALQVDPQAGRLQMVNSQTSDGMHPCYIGLDPEGKFVMTANYSSGSLSVFPVKADGSLGKMSSHIQHQGSSFSKDRQKGPHAHSIQFDLEGKWVLAADLGLDRVLVYKLNKKGELVDAPLWGAAMKPGAGPRHLAFHPNHKVVYVANELDSTVTACRWDADLATLCPFQNLPTLPASFKEENAVADIHLTPDAKFLYVSNRGADSLACYAVQADGSLKSAGFFACEGNWPRNFGIDPSGKWLVCANQYSNTLTVFKIDQKKGGLKFTGVRVEVPSPVCVEFVNPAEAKDFAW